MKAPVSMAEIESHKILSRFQRARLLTVFFSLRDNNLPRYMDPVDSVLFMIPLQHFESFFSALVPRDELMDKILGLSI